MTLWKELTTDRLRLRALQAADEGPITMFAGDRRVAWMTGPIPHPYPPGAAAAYIAASQAGKGQLVWALDATPSGGADFVGVIGYGPNNQTIGYWIGPPFWRQGYATEAAKRLSDYLLTEGGIDMVKASAMLENRPSQKVLERAGFSPTGQAPSFSVARAAPVEVATYQRHAS